jgi:6-phosphogluconolactonase
MAGEVYQESDETNLSKMRFGMRVIVVMGVAGSGKTTVGQRLAQALACDFLEGDLLHPPANVESMRRGVALTDRDREPWLDRLHDRMLAAVRAGERLVVACSALKEAYRTRLARGVPTTWVYLKAEASIIRERLEGRRGHFFDAALLSSQFADLEEPADAIVVNAALAPEAIVRNIVQHLRAAADVRVFANPEGLSQGVAAGCADVMNAAVRARGRCSIALSGGSTPMATHRLLATEFHDRIPWDRVHVFWGDERYVPHDDPRSNYRMARETLLDHVPCPPAQIHPVPTHFANAADAAADYEQTLRRHFDRAARFDLAIMGMGPDGHTASLFPHAAALTERSRWVLAVAGTAEPALRVTLTIPAFAASRTMYFLVTGAEKSNPVARVLSGRADGSSYPAAALMEAAPQAVWWLDAAAASWRT